MKKLILIFVLQLLSYQTLVAQQLPPNACGIVYVHDATGARTKRVYFCNNGMEPYPERAPIGIQASRKDAPFTKIEEENLQVSEVDALYPNPTTGIFYITLAKPLSNAAISFTEINGKVIKKFTASGIKLTCDLSAFAAGVYIVRIEEKGKVISKKVIKK